MSVTEIETVPVYAAIQLSVSNIEAKIPPASWANDLLPEIALKTLAVPIVYDW